MDFLTTLYESIKARFVEVQGPIEFGNGESKTRQLYYLKYLADNLFAPMNERHVSEFMSGSGSELDWKMNSIRSSSAMTFNLIGNDQIELCKGNLAGVYRVQYEFQLPTLRDNPHPANIDVYLEGSSTDIYCEMKMLEWLQATYHKIRNAYFCENGYLLPPAEAARFIELFQCLTCVDDANEECEGGWISNVRYDGFQMAKHLLAIYTRIVNDSDYRPRRIVLLNCVWQMANPKVLGKYEDKYLKMLKEEHVGFEVFRKLSLENIKPLFDSKGIDLEIRYTSALEFMKMANLDDGRKSFLNRYVI